MTPEREAELLEAVDKRYLDGDEVIECLDTIARWRPVIEAAKAYRQSTGYRWAEVCDNLCIAVDALQEAEKTP